MRVPFVVAGLVAFSVFATPVMGADMPVKARPYIAPISNWTGFYVGAFAGYHAGDITQSGCVGLCAVDPKLNGALVGVQFGYDYQLPNNVVLGAFGWIPVVTPRTTINIGGPGLDFHVRPKFAALGAGRIGLAMGNALPYVFAGAGVADNEIHSDVTNLTPSAHHSLGAVGAGLEYKIAPNWSVDGKFMYIAVAKRTYDFGGGPEQYGENSANVLFAINYRP
jgi:outer membrane immunogenic protein